MIVVRVSWKRVTDDLSRLASAIRMSSDVPWKGIVAVARGGLIPAAILAQKLDIRQIYTLNAQSYDSSRGSGSLILNLHQKSLGLVAGKGSRWIVADDLVDTGATFSAVKELLPKAHFVCLYAKPAGEYRTHRFVRRYRQEQWILFPWEDK